MLLGGFKSFIEEKDQSSVKEALDTVREKLDDDLQSITQAHLALYMFQDAVSELTSRFAS